MSKVTTHPNIAAYLIDPVTNICGQSIVAMGMTGGRDIDDLAYWGNTLTAGGHITLPGIYFISIVDGTCAPCSVMGLVRIYDVMHTLCVQSGWSVDSEAPPTSNPITPTTNITHWPPKGGI